MLRQAPKKSYDFNRASVRDVLRFLADDAGIDFVALPESGDDAGKLITFSLNKSPFSALETICRMNGVTLLYEDDVWHMRPLNDQTLIARTYRIRFNASEVSSGSGGGGATTSGPAGAFGGATGGGGYAGAGGGGSGDPYGGGGGGGTISGLGLSGTTGVFSTDADELVDAIKGIVGIQISGVNALIAPGENTVGNFGPLGAGTGVLTSATATPQVISSATQTGGSGGGQVLWNSDTNSLFVVATRQQHQLVEKYLETIDKPQPLIAVEVKFFETTKDPRRQLGVDWSGTMDGGYNMNLSGLATNVDLGQLGDTQLPTTAVLSAPDVSVRIQALLKDRATTTVSYPRVLTRNNREVAIQSVVNQPVLSAQSSTTGGIGGTQTSSVSYLPIGTSINVLPKQLEDGRIALQVLITLSSIIGSEIIDGNAYPVASSRVFTAPLEVESGYTLAIGGLDEASDSREGTGLPVLSKLPLIKHAFRNNTESHTRKNMLIFITPTILDARSGGIQEEPISEVPLRGFDDRVPVPRVRPDGSLVGGLDALAGAIAWMKEEFTLLEQIIIERRAEMEHREQLGRLINTSSMLRRQIRHYMANSPADHDRLELQLWELDELEAQMRERRRELFRRQYQLFSRPLTRLSN